MVRLVSNSGDPSTLASQSAGITGVSHCTRPRINVLRREMFLLDRLCLRVRMRAEQRRISVLSPRPQHLISYYLHFGFRGMNKRELDVKDHLGLVCLPLALGCPELEWDDI